MHLSSVSDVQVCVPIYYTGDRAQRTRFDRILALIGERGGSVGEDQGAAGVVKTDIAILAGSPRPFPTDISDLQCIVLSMDFWSVLF